MFLFILIKSQFQILKYSIFVKYTKKLMKQTYFFKNYIIYLVIFSITKMSKKIYIG